MSPFALAALVAVMALGPALSSAKESGSHSPSHSGGKSNATSGSHSKGSRPTAAPGGSGSHSGSGSHNKAAPGVRRDAHGRIARDPRATNAFRTQQPCPSTGKSSGSCPGYVIDHVVPLKRGGADSPGNMQWQTEGAAKQKDKWE